MLVVGVASLVPVRASAGTAAGAPRVSSARQWSVSLGSNRPIALSSPTVVTLDGDGPSVVVGDRAGYVDAYHLRDGSRVAGWPAKTGAPVDSTPSVAKSGSAAVVFVGSGNAGDPDAGGYFAYHANGAVLWHRVAARTPTSSAASGVQASMAVGTLQASYDVVAGDLGQELYEMAGSSGAVRSGFPWFQADSNFSTPAIANVGYGHNDIVVGGASTAGNAFNHQYTNGGHIRILAPTGHGSASSPAAAGLVCELDTNQEVDSSPAVGRFLSGGGIGIVAGTGTYWSGASQTDFLIAMNPRCGVVWHDTLDSGTGTSPALVDALGNNGLQIAQTTLAGSVYLLNGATGKAIWHVKLPGQIYGGASSVDLGGGYQDVVVGTTSGVYLLDGRTGSTVTTIETGVGTQNTPLVTADPDGRVGITVAGYGSGNVGSITHYEIAGSTGSRVGEAGSWPQFHHDPQLTGVGTIPAPKPTPPNPAQLVRSGGTPGVIPTLRRVGRR